MHFSVKNGVFLANMAVKHRTLGLSYEREDKKYYWEGVMEPKIESELKKLLIKSQVLSHQSALSGLTPETSLYDAVDYHLSNPGSGARMSLSLAASLALDISPDKAAHLAAAVESLHNASLIQDDLQDRDDLRRGKPAVWKKFGPDLAINATDLLLSNAYALVANIDGVSSVQQLISTMHQAVVKTLQGQMKDLSRNQSESITEGIAIAADKSGPLFSLSLQLPLILAGHEDYVDLAGETGSLFGVGYQIFDDIQDLSKDRCADNHFNLAQLVNEKGLSGIPDNRAEDLAHSYLAQALKSASKLPNGCANLLCENCVTLLAVLEKEAA
ncbi:MAG TPA: hypothetical protein DCS80_05375 [Betaproteobacteria bacterium]|jgi:geranylgeranyl pyrophosphate synthase|nr:hypothetical protein [Betaproteobacteria bacterium]